MCPLFAKDKEKKWLLDAPSREHLKNVFKEHLDKDVQILLFASEEENQPYGEFCRSLLHDLHRLDARISFEEYDLSSPQAKTHDVTRAPTLLVQPDQYAIRFTGAPAGEEAQTLIQTLFLVSTGRSGLAEDARATLAALKEKRHVRIFVNPGCPYCPAQVLNGIKAAIERPDLVAVECIETGENQDLAEAFHVGSVPHTVYGPELETNGMEPEQVFMEQLVTLVPSKEVAGEDFLSGEEMSIDLVIAGAGPAGLAAGIYASRAGLSAVVLEGGIVGGQVAVTPVVENYPGFSSIGGKELVAVLLDQARAYLPVQEGEEVVDVSLGRHVTVTSTKGRYRCKALLVATGATWKHLGLDGEERFLGRGISYCASCDGYLYKGKEVLVVGGGNTALTEALHLRNLGVDVRIVHRRDAFRAEKHLQDAVEREKIPVLWNKIVVGLHGKDVLGEVELEDTQTKEIQKVKVHGVFLAIGIKPNTSIVTPLGIKVDANGYVQTDGQGRTSLPRIYAAGDVTGGVQQIVTAVSEGSVAAMSVFEDLGR
ncbi:FAD-dependent oxidoreductase [Desulfoplanes formicivorans]|uniref:Thioredoxin reductase n=1 Tax=Desulfoplanes formicivorans TaxID=1592317 RepID=A0A194AJV1_9BACT|nr:FAD-dependent oxidoreductase [Desulfoplanes formicivorans]GAU09520.1 thioredoxin reductase [Desulfoplanes formicivorans]